MNNKDWSTYYSGRLSEEIVQLHTKANIFEESQKYEDAINCLDEAIRIDPTSPYLWLKKYYPLNRLNRFQEIIDCLDEAIRLNPDYVDAWELKGSALVDKNKKIIHDAFIRKVTHKTFALDDNDIARRYEKALECYEEVIRLSLDDTGGIKETWRDVLGYREKANILNELKRFEESVKFCTETIEHFKWMESHLRLQLWETKIKALLELKTYATVILECDYAKHDLGFINYTYYNYRYDALIELKHFEDAVECCNDVIEKYSNSIDELFDTDEWYGYKFDALAQLKRFEEALKCLDYFSSGHKYDALTQLKRFEEALKFCNERIDEEEDPVQMIEILFDKCDALTQLKRVEEALKCCNEISKLDPSEDYDWQDQKNKLLKKLGRKEETDMSNDES